jgi:hypothetical protein
LLSCFAVPCHPSACPCVLWTVLLLKHQPSFSRDPTVFSRESAAFSISDAGIEATATVCMSTHGHTHRHTCRQTDRRTDHGMPCHAMPSGSWWKICCAPCHAMPCHNTTPQWHRPLVNVASPRIIGLLFDAAEKLRIRIVRPPRMRKREQLLQMGVSRGGFHGSHIFVLIRSFKHGFDRSNDSFNLKWRTTRTHHISTSSTL